MRRLLFSGMLLAAIAGCKQEDLAMNPKPGQSVSFKGEIARGVECPMLIVSSDHRYALAGELGGFKTGDQVCVQGTIAEVSQCMAGEATIAVTSIVPADSCK